ncbi:hypothetical protein LshimejAT787_0212390 [Lyophyllum shimeji]|uniref:Uncharacterized protein n=1 Tax=Lyophyllum shimeji TaxID=47721 RepID=A0A9P3PHP8_LYOSH|nr:hypothetical protein LshimejAT787_0212390 [Lyophyllum shimeji]
MDDQFPGNTAGIDCAATEESGAKAKNTLGDKVPRREVRDAISARMSEARPPVVTVSRYMPEQHAQETDVKHQSTVPSL